MSITAIDSDAQNVLLNPKSHINQETGKIYDTSFRAAHFIKGEFYNFFVDSSDGQLLKRTWQNPVSTNLYGMAFRRNHKLFEIFNEKCQQLFEGGFFENYVQDYRNDKNPKRYEKFAEPEGPKILTMKHLEAGFMVWIVSVMFSIFVFMCEWHVRLRGYLVFKYVISAYQKERRTTT